MFAIKISRHLEQEDFIEMLAWLEENIEPNERNPRFILNHGITGKWKWNNIKYSPIENILDVFEFESHELAFMFKMRFA